MHMAQSQNPMTGQMKGSMANFATTTRSGANVIRAKAFNPKDANTPAQQLQRACFKLIGEEYQTFGGITDEGFPEANSNQSGYNLFIGANLPGAIDKSRAEPVIDYSKLVVSAGSLLPLIVTEAKVTASGISISYQMNVRIPKVNATDEVVVVTKTQIGELLVEKQPRGDAKTGNIVVDYPGIQAADVKCCYLFLRNGDGSKASKSVYVPVTGA
jgi:hypothetical protein